MNSKNYSAATRILIQLINFENKNIESDILNEKYVSLDDRRTYVKHLLYCIDLMLENPLEEEMKNFFIKLKNQMMDLRDTYLIQSDIFLNLKNIKEKISNKPTQEIIDESLMSLDRNYFNLEELYNLYSKRFKFYEINLQIFFEMAKRNCTLDNKEIQDNYENYLKFLIGRSEEKLKWPQVMFPMVK